MKYFLIIFLITVSVYPQTYRRMAYLSRSVGQHIYQHAGATTDIPTELAAYNTAHSYTGGNACTITNVYPYPTGTDVNTLWGWWEVFDSTVTSDDIYTDYINNSSYDIIMVKECFASQSDIWFYWYEGPQDTVNYPETHSIYNYQWYCRKILKKMEQHPSKFFVWWNIPPMIAGTTADAQRLYDFNKWLTDTLQTGLDSKYGAFPDNVYIYDYYSMLADINHQLPLAYADASDDSHPNADASELVAPDFVTKAFDAAIAYEGEEPPVAATKPRIIIMNR